MRILSPTTLFALTILAAGAAAQVEIKVPQDFPTIQAAVNAANDEDKIFVSAGTYTENVVITGAHLLFITAKGKVVIDAGVSEGMRIEDSDFVFIQGFRTTGGTNGFRLVNCTSCQLIKCRVEGSSADGVRLQGGSSNAILKTMVKDAGFHGIALSGGIPTATNNNQVIACKIIEPSHDGVAINGSNNLIITCKVIGAHGNGMTVQDFAAGTDNQFQRCKILQPTGNGLEFTGNGMVVDRCTITEPGGHGIRFVDGAGGGAGKTKVIKAGQDGVSIGGDFFELSQAKIAKPANEGVIVSGDNAIVSKCKVSAAGANGFSIQGLLGAYTSNKSSSATLDGFLLQGLQNTLSLNKASGSGGFDLDNPVPANNTVDPDNKFKTQGP